MYKDPVRNVDNDLLSHLEVVSKKIFPLPGATFDTTRNPDARLPHLKPMSGLPGGEVRKITYYEHVATIRDFRSNKFFVAFRQTKDAQMLEQLDPVKYPEWLIKDKIKDTELKIYIYAVRCDSNGKPLIPSKMPGLQTHEDWLTHIDTMWVFDTVAYFLLKNNIIDEKMYGNIS
jgi:hypothetical protein